VDFIGRPERLDDVLQQSDYLAITLSLSPETRGLIDARRLDLMKPSAILVNVARAEIIDEKALGPFPDFTGKERFAYANS
jgi:phosphoglycerate dehydrogenase-like enzyme